jgi:sugar lactone lactonase YvrE
MRRCWVRLFRRGALIALVSSPQWACSLTFDAGELTSGSGGAMAAAAGAGNTGLGGIAGTGGHATPAPGARQIFWLEEGSDTVKRASSDGSNQELLIDVGANSYLRSIALDPQGSALYYSDEQQSRIERASLTGANRGLIAALDNPVGLDIDIANGKLYFADQGAVPGVFRVSLDGSALEPLITTGIARPYGVALDVAAGHVYVVDNGVNAILRANLDGSALTNLNVPDVDQPIQISLELDAGKFYWSEIGQLKRIRRANLDGSAAEVIVSAASFAGLSQPLGLKVDTIAQALYFIDGNTILRSNLDGSGIRMVLSDLEGPVGLALAY